MFESRYGYRSSRKRKSWLERYLTVRKKDKIGRKLSDARYGWFMVAVLGAIMAFSIKEQRDSDCSLPDNLPSGRVTWSGGTYLPERVFTKAEWDKVRTWCSLVDKYSQKYGMDPELVAVVMLVESGGTSNAVSKSGAVGLMQAMPRDGKAAGFMCDRVPCFANRPTIAQLSNPEFNVEFCVRLLASEIREAGSVEKGLRRYGPLDVGDDYAHMVLWLRKQIGE